MLGGEGVGRSVAADPSHEAHQPTGLPRFETYRWGLRPVKAMAVGLGVRPGMSIGMSIGATESQKEERT